jgi:hypothetical protein
MNPSPSPAEWRERYGKFIGDNGLNLKQGFKLEPFIAAEIKNAIESVKIDKPWFGSIDPTTRERDIQIMNLGWNTFKEDLKTAKSDLIRKMSL